MSRVKKAKPVRSEKEVEKLVEDNMRLAWFFVVKYENWHRDEHERLSYAMRGLHEAAQFWEPKAGIPFGTYASMRINWQFFRINAASKRIKRGAGKVHFLPLDFEMDGGKRLCELIEDEKAIAPFGAVLKSEQAIKLYELMIKLPDRERFVLERRFGASNYEPMTLEQISLLLGVTRERVRQIEQEALGRLRCLYTGEPFRWNHMKKIDQQGRKPGSAFSAVQKKLTKQAVAARFKTR